MNNITSNYENNSGWWCPTCQAYHSPDTKTCPNSGTSTPTTPPWYPYPTTPDDGFFEKRVCGKCGLQLSNVMMYVCANPGCPTGLGGSYCTMVDFNIKN